MAQAFDIVVIGGGISGVSLAARLAAKRSVALAETEEHLGMHATGRSAALLVEALGPPEIRRLTGMGRTFFEQPPDGFSDAPLSSRRRGLTYAGPGQVEALRREFDLASQTTEVVWLDAGEVLRACPLLRPGVAAAGFLELNTLALDANALLQGFARQARANGAQFFTGSPVGRIGRKGDAWAVLAGDSEVEAGILAVAAGAWADRVAAMAGIAPLGLQPMRRTAATLALPPEFADSVAGLPFVAPIDESFYFKPDASGIMVSLSEETPSDPRDAWPEDLDVAMALERFHEATIVPRARPIATWAGLRTFSPDRRPVIGFDAAVPGFFWYAGQGGYGIQTSPAASMLGAKLILGETADGEEAALAEALRPGRFSRA